MNKEDIFRTIFLQYFSVGEVDALATQRVPPLYCSISPSTLWYDSCGFFFGMGYTSTRKKKLFKRNLLTLSGFGLLNIFVKKKKD